MSNHTKGLFILGFLGVQRPERSIAFPHTGGVVTPSFLRRFPAAARPQRRATRLKGILSPSSAYCAEPLICYPIPHWWGVKRRRKFYGSPKLEPPFLSEITTVLSRNYLSGNLGRWNAESGRRNFAFVSSWGKAKTSCSRGYFPFGITERNFALSCSRPTEIDHIDLSDNFVRKPCTFKYAAGSRPAGIDRISRPLNPLIFALVALCPPGWGHVSLPHLWTRAILRGLLRSLKLRSASSRSARGGHFWYTLFSSFGGNQGLLLKTERKTSVKGSTPVKLTERFVLAAGNLVSGPPFQPLP